MAKSNGENGPRAPAAGESLSGTRESLAQGPDAATTDELSSLGSDSEANGFAERRIDKFGFIVGSQGAEGAFVCGAKRASRLLCGAVLGSTCQEAR
ncbi:TBC1D10A isoform 8 [Pan troglodytes]|uniref:TBC1 domain family member 10A n=4 Tax=Hominidae TaxID=9604 RepID=F8WDN6_HUMAN|nr:TBC1 domain family member 10A [Homo sapiens]KAI4002442.1 TBC1 domain family member 10A [Homo sapiens]PNI97862.1 TBC1D10A isoform 8 [Pan troglodytes]PNJ49099.1 TBC1D10A isoform 8 [Pongo abelii]